MDTVPDAASLITTRNDVINGFRWQSEEKARRASGYSTIAIHFRVEAPKVNSIDQFLSDPKLFSFALGACALSAKGAGHLGKEVCKGIITSSIDIARLSDDAYLAELEGRYFLTCGDALGGTMRNVIGQRAQKKLVDNVVKYLGDAGIECHVVQNTEAKITEIRWRDRTLVFDRKPIFIGKNIDLILLASDHYDKKLLENENIYLACGELKGGIDPAGADEHWKTVTAALDRVRTAFENRDRACPALFFVGAAIEPSMAREIHSQLETGALNSAANLNHVGQMNELTARLTDL